jgi:hypothetical protein
VGGIQYHNLRVEIGTISILFLFLLGETDDILAVLGRATAASLHSSADLKLKNVILKYTLAVLLFAF